LFRITNRILSAVSPRVKVEKEKGGGGSASTAEGIQLDETAVGSMEIEWAKGVALGRGGDECEVEGEW
jgi:hypothetical protein